MVDDTMLRNRSVERPARVGGINSMEFLVAEAALWRRRWRWRGRVEMSLFFKAYPQVSFPMLPWSFINFELGVCVYQWPPCSVVELGKLAVMRTMSLLSSGITFNERNGNDWRKLLHYHPPLRLILQ